MLQEVAAARHILIMCGSTAIDGYAFYLGLQSLEQSLPKFQNPIHPITYLIKGSIFRPKYATSPSGVVSLGICSLGELIDMYHTHGATERHDKVFALLGMSTSHVGKPNLSISCEVPWEKLLEQTVKFILGQKVAVKACDKRELAIVKSKGWILGRVSSEQSIVTWDGRQGVVSF